MASEGVSATGLSRSDDKCCEKSTTTTSDEDIASDYDDEDAARLVVWGEVAMLTTAVLRIHRAHHNYYYGGRTSGNVGLKGSVSVPSRLAAAAASENDEDEDEYLDDALGFPSEGGAPTINSSPIDPILKNLISLKGKLRKSDRNGFSVLTDPTYLRPFCEVIKNKDTSGPITGMALQSVLNFISYGLVAKVEHLGAVIAIGESVTKARFVGTETGSDEVVLGRILSVLRELIVRGFPTLTNELVCEIMQSCFRIAFEPRLSELLRKSAEQALIDMCRSLFKRVNSFPNVAPVPIGHIKMGGGMKLASTKKRQAPAASDRSTEINSTPKISPTATEAPPVPSEPLLVNSQGVKFAEKPPEPAEPTPPVAAPAPPPVVAPTKRTQPPEPHGIASIHELFHYLISLINPLPESQNTEAMINVGLNLLIIAFESSVTAIGKKTCLMSIVKNELCWNIIMLMQSDKPLTMFASTLRLAFRVFTSLRCHLKYQFESLLNRLMDIVATGNAPLESREMALEYLVGFFRHITYLPHELFYNYDCDPSASNLLEDLLQLFSKNCFASSISNPKTQRTVPPETFVTFSSIQLLSLDALLACLKSLQKAELVKDACLVVSASHRIPLEEAAAGGSPKAYRKLSLPKDVDVGRASSETNLETLSESSEVIEKENEQSEEPLRQSSPEPASVHELFQQFSIDYPKTIEEVDRLKERKKLLWAASEQFNAKPTKGIAFLQENGLVSDEKGIASFLRDTSRLDKKVIGEYISNKKHQSILSAFVEDFPFKGIRIDEALRMYLESFRLPGEAPLIFMILEQFAHHWRESNGQMFENEDAAFRLAYAIIMLNVDQHNSNAKRQMVPMTCEAFTSNLRDLNGGKDFDPELLKEIYHNIKANEIVMPAEQQGVVREKYLWKCLLRRSETEHGMYWLDKGRRHQGRASEDKESKLLLQMSLLNGQIFGVLWGPTVAAMTFIFDKININHNSSLTRRILNNGFNSCALLCATYGHLDNLIVSLCKFTVNSAGGPTSPLLSHKSQLAAQCLFGITHEYANEMRDSWSNIIELILNWYKAYFLDDALEIEERPGSGQKIKIRRKVKKPQKNLNEGSTFLSSFYSYFAGSQQEQSGGGYTSDGEGSLSGEQSQEVAEPNNHLINNVCQPLLLIEESKYLHIDSLLELIKALMNVVIELEEDEDRDDIASFKLEILLQIIRLNRDRVSICWPQVSSYLLKVVRVTALGESLAERIIFTVFTVTDFTTEPAKQEQVWQTLWCPLLQGISVLCCDARRPVRACALSYLQRALLMHELRILTASQWESCFHNVLFPLLERLREPLSTYEPIDMDETRMRAANLLCKVFLQHLTALLSLPTFTALWMTILDFMDKYMKIDTQTDLVREAIPESLKNVLLVMHTAGCLDSGLSNITWDRIALFLPSLRQEIDPEPTAESTPQLPVQEHVKPVSTESPPALSDANFSPEHQAQTSPEQSPVEEIPSSPVKVAEPMVERHSPDEPTEAPTVALVEAHHVEDPTEHFLTSIVVEATPAQSPRPLPQLQSKSSPAHHGEHSLPGYPRASYVAAGTSPAGLAHFIPYPYPGQTTSASQPGTSIVKSYPAPAQAPPPKAPATYPWPAPSDNKYSNM